MKWHYIDEVDQIEQVGAHRGDLYIQFSDGKIIMYLTAGYELDDLMSSGSPELYHERNIKPAFPYKEINPNLLP